MRKKPSLKGIQSAASSPSLEPLRMSADVVVVGLGAGGGMVFHDLAKAGVDVLGLEVGSCLGPEEMTGQEETMLPHLFAEGGARATEDFSVSVLQGRGVGGSTLHNTNLCKRLPQEILQQWSDDYGLDNLLSPRFEQDFADVESLLNVHPVPDEQVNANNRALWRGVDALGYKGGRLSQNRKDCQQSGLCEVGCPNDGKQNVSKVLVPPALKAGGRILTEARVDAIMHHKGKVVGVKGHAVDPQTRKDTRPFVVHAKRVVLSASATASAAIALRSNLPDPHQLAGTNLHMHPGAIVMGMFNDTQHEAIKGWLGVPQAIECTEFLDHGRDAQHRVWLVSGFAHPGGASAFVPGFGARHARLMQLYPNMAAVIVMLHDRASGRIRPGNAEKVHIFYKLDRDEYEQLATGLRAAGRLLLAAGADQVIVPTAPPTFASTEAEINNLQARDLGPLNPTLAAVHPMSTLWMGANPSNSVVSPTGEHHHVRGLYVADSSLFPTSIGGPPQIPIYTLGRHVARHIQHDLG